MNCNWEVYNKISLEMAGLLTFYRPVFAYMQTHAELILYIYATMKCTAF
jgi:hypothetical protein